MEPRAHHVWIGLLTVGMAAAGLLLGIWLTEGEVYSEHQPYKVVFRESVSGLSARSPVKLNGINVGEVEKLSMDPEDPRQVIARIRISNTVAVRTDMRAQIGKSSLFAGGAHIRLKPGEPDAPLLERPDDGIPRIPSKASPMARLQQDSDQLLAGINDLVRKGNRLLSEENIQQLEATLTHLEQTSRAIAARRDELQRSLSALADGSEEASLTLQEARALIEESHALLTGPGEKALRSSARATAALARSSERTDTLLQENQAAIERGLESLQDVEPLAQELQHTLNRLRSAIRRLESNPARLLRRERMEEHEP